jgi:hypothetical protein
VSPRDMIHTTRAYVHAQHIRAHTGDFVFLAGLARTLTGVWWLTPLPLAAAVE